MFKYVVHFFKHYFDFSGRASKKEMLIGVSIVIFILLISRELLINALIRNSSEVKWYIPLVFFIMLILFPAHIAIMVRRMHDIGRPGSDAFIPFVGFFQSFEPSQKGPNQYGDEPILWDMQRNMSFNLSGNKFILKSKKNNNHIVLNGSFFVLIFLSLLFVLSLLLLLSIFWFDLPQTFIMLVLEIITLGFVLHNIIKCFIKKKSLYQHPIIYYESKYKYIKLLKNKYFKLYCFQGNCIEIAVSSKKIFHIAHNNFDDVKGEFFTLSTIINNNNVIIATGNYWDIIKLASIINYICTLSSNDASIKLLYNDDFYPPKDLRSMKDLPNDTKCNSSSEVQGPSVQADDVNYFQCNMRC